MELIHKRNEFYENLISKVNFGNMGETPRFYENRYFRFTLDKISDIRKDVRKTDHNWQN